MNFKITFDSIVIFYDRVYKEQFSLIKHLLFDQIQGKYQLKFILKKASFQSELNNIIYIVL